MDFRFGGPPVQVHPPVPPQFPADGNQLIRPIFQLNNGHGHYGPPASPPVFLQQAPLPPPHFFPGAPVPNYHFGEPLHFQQIPFMMPLLPPPLLQHLHPFPSILPTQITGPVLSDIVQLAEYNNLQQQGVQTHDPDCILKEAVYLHLLNNVFEYILHPEVPDVNQEQILEDFKTLPLSEQLIKFFDWLHLPNEQIRIRWQIAFDMEYFLRQLYPRCQVYVFGSLLTDLGNLQSDVDMYADLFGDDGLRIRRTLCEDGGSFYVRDRLRFEIEQINRCPHHGDQPFVRNIRALGTRVPFLRFVHAATGIMCDLTFASRISVQNSKMLNFYLTYDPRLGPLLIFLRYWGEVHGISGERKIKKYALALLALVFLMQRGEIPSVELLQELARRKREAGGMGGMNPDFLEGWDSSFCEDIGYVRRMAGTRPVEILPGYPYSQPEMFLELCLDFFEMWQGVDFGEVVICPLSGELKRRDEFLSGANMRDREWRKHMYRNFGGDKKLAIQDPFVRTFNVGAIADDETVDKFQEMCELAFRRMVGQRGRMTCMLDFFMGEFNQGGEGMVEFFGGEEGNNGEN